MRGRRANASMVRPAAKPAAPAKLAAADDGARGRDAERTAEAKGAKGSPANAEPKNAEPKSAEPKSAEPKSAEPKKVKPKNAEPKKAKPKPTTKAKASQPTVSGARSAATRRRTLKRSRYTKAETEALFARLAEALPEPRTELDYTNPFTLLIAVLLSAQATDVGVNKATGPLFEVASTPEAMLALGEERVREAIKTIGLFNTKAKNVIALSRALVEEHGGEVPADRDALQALPGVGRKTASVVLNVAFGQPTIAVDTHIFRLGNRLGLAPGRTPDEVADVLERVTPERYVRGAHHWLILHGRHVCKARRPLCEGCVIYDLCKARERRRLPAAD